MNTYLMLDDVNTALLEKYAGPAHAVAGYVNGSYANWSTLVAKYAKSGKFLLSIDVANKPSLGAQCLDIETYDAVIADAPGWFKTTQAAGAKAKDFRYYPKLYTSASNVASLISTMTKAGIARNRYMIWSAHYTGSAHICGPKTCGYPQADATQWTSSYQGVSLDASLCYGYFFAGPPAAPAPAPKPKPKPTAEPELKNGSTGTAVKLLQTLLNGRPIKPNLAVDGDFGPATLRAVETVQRNNKLSVDGIVGPQTWALLGNYS